MSKQTTTLISTLKAGLIVGFIGAGLNNIWSLIAGYLGATIPPGFVIPITISSFLPVIIGAIIFYLLVRFSPKANQLWTVLGLGFTLVSFYPVFTTTQLPDGTILDKTFPLLVGPMHAISGFLAVWGIPKWSK